MLQIKNITEEITGCQPQNLPPEVLGSNTPLLLKGLVADWPVVRAGLESVENAAAYIQQFDRNLPMTVFAGGPDIDGRIFYNDDLSGFNFQRVRANLAEVLSRLHRHRDDARPPTFYVGSTMVDNWLPGFRTDNDLGLEERQPLVSIWLGNQSRIAAHYDFPNNIACSVAGHRRFTLFPPEQLANLYVGPLDMTPAGQAISMVDFKRPDYDRFPKFREAAAAAQVADLAPGDAVFVPSMWWHHVESLAPFNVLVNYWWRPIPLFMGTPLDALQHAFMGLRNLPPEQRRIWKQLFDYYVFSPNEEAFRHIPPAARGVLNGVDEVGAQKIRAQLLKQLRQP